MCRHSLQEELVKSATFRYITDAITPNEALAILKAKEATKSQREDIVRLKGCVCVAC
jgi:L-fuconate dehydratase